MNTPTDKEVRDWYMGYGVDGRAELASVEGDAFDRYLLERDVKITKVTGERIIKLLSENADNTNWIEYHMDDLEDLIRMELDGRL